MKLWNSITSGFLLAPLALASTGCPSEPGDDEAAGTTVSDDTTTTTTGDDTTGSSTAVAESSSGEPGTTGVPTECQEPRPVPESPFDCAGASTVIDGHVLIEDGEMDPSVLEGVVEVTGELRINGTAETNLDFMACIHTVGEELNIFDNDQLTNVDGLHNLTSVRDFVFSGNDALEDFDGLPLLEQMDGGVVIRENGSLRTITGFHSFVGLNGMGIDPKTNEVIGGNLTIQENPVLEDIDGFGQIRVVNGRVQITNNPLLCISSIMCVVLGIVQPAMPPDSWSTAANNGGC